MRRPIVPLTASAAAAGAAAWLLPDPWRAPAWAGLGASWLALSTWGVVSIRSGLFGPARTRGSGTRPEVALTWDDGPDPDSTPALLDLLRARGVRGCFFCVGERARAHPQLVRRIADEGHLVGNHSQRHAWGTNFLGTSALALELSQAQACLAEASGQLPRYYRPPVGLMNHAVDGATRAVGLEVIGWSVRSLDTTRRRAPERVVRRVLARVHPGALVLLHDGGLPAARVVAIASGILDGLAARGLTARRLDEVLEGTSPYPGPP